LIKKEQKKDAKCQFAKGTGGVRIVTKRELKVLKKLKRQGFRLRMQSGRGGERGKRQKKDAFREQGSRRPDEKH